MVKKNQKKSLITSSIITIVIVAILLLSGPLANALMVTLTADKTNVTAGAAGAAGNITFTTWVNLSNPDRYVPIQRIYLNLSGPLAKSFSFDAGGGTVQGTGFNGELTVSTSGEFNPSNYGYGSGYAYGYNTGSYYDFGYGYGYGYGYGSGGSTPLNVLYTITLNTTNMFDGNYTATTNVYAAGMNAAQGFTSTTSVAFVINPRIFTVSIPVIPAGTSADSGLIQTPTGNYSYTIVAGNNATIPVTLNVTVQVNPPTGVSTQVNSTGTGGLGAGAIPSLYFNYSVNDSTWYDNISYIHMQMYYNQSAIPSNVDESTLRPARYLSNTTPASWVKMECGTCTRTLEVAEDGRNVNLIASGVDTSSNFVWANVTHYSSYGMGGTVTSTSSVGGSTGGTGGGGGVVTAESFDNIAKSESYDKNLVANTPVTYTFKAPELGVYEIAFTGKENENGITLRVEALKGTSKQVTAQPPGTVYKNINILAGTKRMKEALVRFRVENSWLGSNSLAGSDVKMLHWVGSQWTQLETAQTTKDDTYTYYETKTDTFSPFAISGIKGGVLVPTATPAGAVTETPVMPTGTATPAPTRKVPGFEFVLTVAILSAAYLSGRKRR